MKFMLIFAVVFASYIGVYQEPIATHYATTQSISDVKTYKVTLTNSKVAHNREVYIQAKSSSGAKQTALDQNPGWKVLLVSEVKK